MPCCPSQNLLGYSLLYRVLRASKGVSAYTSLCAALTLAHFSQHSQRREQAGAATSSAKEYYHTRKGVGGAHAEQERKKLDLTLHCLSIRTLRTGSRSGKVRRSQPTDAQHYLVIDVASILVLHL